MRVLVLGGTGEARELAAGLVGSGVDVITSLAGQSTQPALPVGAVRVGRFGTDDQLATYLRDEHVRCVVDATHPFAATISARAVRVCAGDDVPIIVLRRPGWSPGEGDRWTRVADLAAAAEVVRVWSVQGAVFLTTGRRDLTAFAGDADHEFVVRSIDPPQGPLPPRSSIVLQRGPFGVDAELAIMRQHAVSLLVTKDSGGDATVAKLIAARQLSLPVLVVDRPALPDVEVVGDTAAAMRWVLERFADGPAPSDTSGRPDTQRSLTWLDERG